MKKIFIILMLLLPVCGWSQEAFFPGLTGPVVDTTSTLKADQVKLLAQKSLALQKENGAQIAVCIINSTAPLPIEDYGIKLAGKWKIGRAKIDDGVIVIVALKDRKMRIEVGYGLEPVITDLRAGRIVDRIMAPSFRRGDFYQGLSDAVDALTILIKNGETAYVAGVTDRESEVHEQSNPLLIPGIILIVLSVVLFIILLVKDRPVIASLLTFLLMMSGIYLVASTDILSVIGITCASFFPLLFLGMGIKYDDGSGGSSSSSYSSYSSSSSSSYSSSSSSSSSYSGGGGSYGGGGASGSW